jgi:hypothetical protein
MKKVIGPDMDMYRHGVYLEVKALVVATPFNSVPSSSVT